MTMRKQCPGCGKMIDIDETRNVAYCNHCGTRLDDNPAGGYRSNTGYAPAGGYNSAGGYTQNGGYAPAVGYNSAMPLQNYNAAPAGKVVISYSTMRPEYPLSVVVAGKRWTIPNNTRKEFSLPPGAHLVLFYVARRGWKKIVNVPYGNYPVHVNVVYSGRVKIYMQ